MFIKHNRASLHRPTGSSADEDRALDDPADPIKIFESLTEEGDTRPTAFVALFQPSNFTKQAGMFVIKSYLEGDGWRSEYILGSH